MIVADVAVFPGWDSGDPLYAQHRRAWWTLELLDNRSKYLRPLGGVSKCDLEWNVNSVVRTKGTLRYTGAAINWMTHRVRVRYHLEAFGQERSWVLGTFIPASPESDLGDSELVPREVQLYDFLYLLDIQSSTANAWSVPGGSNVVNRVRTLLTNANYLHSLEDSDATTRTCMFWPAGTRYLKIANEALAAINYFSMSADPMGVLVARPYYPPHERGAQWTLRDGGKSIYRPEVKHVSDTYLIPNHVELLSSVGSDEPPLKSNVWDETGGPYSYEVRRIRVSHVEENVDISDQATLDALAARRLRELQRPTSTYSLRHLPLPMQLNDVVELTRERHGVNTLTTVQTMRMSMFEDGLCETTLREVNDE